MEFLISLSESPTQTESHWSFSASRGLSGWASVSRFISESPRPGLKFKGAEMLTRFPGDIPTLEQSMKVNREKIQELINKEARQQ
jgi:hypothetical protein